MPRLSLVVDWDEQLASGPPARVSTDHAWYRLGDAYVDLESDDDMVLSAFADGYGDCEVTPPFVVGAPRIAVRFVRDPGSAHAWITLTGAHVPDLIDVTLLAFRPLANRTSYRDAPARVPGWRVLVDTDRAARPIAASNGRCALVDMYEEGITFWIRQIVSAVQRTQRDVVFLHAASVGVGDVGGLLVAPTHGGKSTTALAVAGRGNALFGDDVAAVRRSNVELIPYRESVGVRDPPLVQELRARLAACPHVAEMSPDGTLRQLVRTRDLFPIPDALPLRYGFVLDGFGASAAVRSFRADRSETPRLRALSAGMLPAWGPTPGTHVTRFLAVVRLMSELECFAVTVGPPDETAALIESVMGAR
jgi:hypothetical protein